MNSPYVLIKVQSERANRLAWACSVGAAVAVLIAAGLAAIFVEADVHQSAKVISILVAGVFAAPVAFIAAGYLVLGIARAVERRRGSAGVRKR